MLKDCLKKFDVFRIWLLTDNCAQAVGCITICFIVTICGLWIGWHRFWGSTQFGARIYFQKAMDRGDSKNAAYWAEKVWKYRVKKVGLNKHFFLQWGTALELNGELAKAGEVYAQNDDDSYAQIMDVARVLYKQGKKEEAFVRYCEAVMSQKFFDGEKIENAVLCWHLGKYRLKLCPFETYADFVRFIEEEYEKAGKPDEYARAVKF